MSNSGIVYPEPYPITPPAERTAKEWVNYYLQIENDVLAGKDVTFDNGRRVILEDLTAIRKARFEWERRAKSESSGHCRQRMGGLCYKTPDFS